MQAAKENLIHKIFTMLARWQEISDPFKTHSIGWVTIQPHHHIVKVSRVCFSRLVGRVKSKKS